jgi:hypothetical protein
VDSAGEENGPNPILELFKDEQNRIDPYGIAGSLASAFDLISAEYGWGDETLLDLTLGRTRQITAAIIKRQTAEHFRQRRLLNWQTKTLATYVAATAMTDGKGNPLLDAASGLDIDGLDFSEIKKAIPKENKAGSFEKLVGASASMRRP